MASWIFTLCYLYSFCNRIKQGNVAVPYMPFSITFLNQGLNTRPTFFGCNGTTDVVFSDKTTKSTTKPPIIAYIPNYPYTYLTNYSTNQLQMSNDQSQATIDNGFQSATLAGITSGSEIDWPLCLACASLQRSFERSNTPIPDKCKTCMEKYCWNGTVNNTVPSTDYTPAIGISQWVIDGAANKMTTSSNGASIIHSTTLCSLSVIFVTSLLLLI
jgi:lysophospholipase